MALIDALLDKITNESLRTALREQVDQLLTKQSFGLVLQQHKPETVELHNYTAPRNCKVRIKSEGNEDLYLVDNVKKGIATVPVTCSTASTLLSRCTRSCWHST